MENEVALAIVMANTCMYSQEQLKALRFQVDEALRVIEYKPASALSFKIGQKVQFHSRDGRPIVMTVERINAQSVSGTQEGPIPSGKNGKWRVHPSFLSPVTPDTFKQAAGVATTLRILPDEAPTEVKPITSIDAW